MPNVGSKRPLVENVELAHDSQPALKRPVTYKGTERLKIAPKRPYTLAEKKIGFTIEHKPKCVWNPTLTTLNVRVRRQVRNAANNAWIPPADPSVAVHATTQRNAMAAGADPAAEPPLRAQDLRAASRCCRWINGAGMKFFKSVSVQPDAGDNIERTPTTTQIAWENWFNYLMMYDLWERDNLVLEDDLIVSRKLIDSDTPDMCGVSTERIPFRRTANRDSNVIPGPYDDDQLHMIEFEQDQHFKRDGDGWEYLRLEIPSDFFRLNDWIHGLASFRLEFEFNSDEFLLVARESAVDGMGTPIAARYEIDDVNSFLEIRYFKQEDVDMKSFEDYYYDGTEIKSFYNAITAHSYFSPAFTVAHGIGDPAPRIITNNYLLNQKFPNHGFICFLTAADVTGNCPLGTEPFKMLTHNIVRWRIELDGKRMHPDGDFKMDERNNQQMHYLWRVQCDAVAQEGSEKRRHFLNLKPSQLKNANMWIYYDLTGNGQDGFQFVTDLLAARADFHVWADHNRVDPNDIGEGNYADDYETPLMHMVVTWFNARHMALENGVQNAWTKAVQIPDHTIDADKTNHDRTGTL